MKTKWISERPKTLAIVFDSGDEVMDGLLKVARKFKLAASEFTAIGAFQSVTLGFFDLTKKDYRKTAIDEQVEALSLIGDVCLNWRRVESATPRRLIVGSLKIGSPISNAISCWQVRPALR